MNIRLVLVKAITLLYLESQLDPNPTTHSRDLVTTLLKQITLPENTEADGSNPLAELRSTLLWLNKTTSSDPIDRGALLQRVRINVGKNDSTYEAVEEGLLNTECKDTLSAAIKQCRSALYTFTSIESLKEVLKEASHTSMFRASKIDDWSDFKNSVITKLEALDLGGDAKSDGSFVASVDFNDPESVKAAFESMEKSLGDEGGMQFPWQAMNRMLGPTGRARRGEFHMYPALPHNYKSGWLLDIFVGLCLFNEPFLFDKTKKPAIIMFSTEDTMDVIIKKLYIVIQQWLNGYEGAVDDKNLDLVKATEIVMGTLRKNGWNVFIHQVLPSQFTYTKYLSVLEDYKTNGYEVAAVVFDYLSMCNKAGCNSDIIGDDVQDLFRRTREYTSANKILHVTAHQLSTEAKALKRVDEESFIQQLPGKGYYERSRKLDTELDFEAYLNIRKFKDESFLEVLWGKHRKLGSTAESAKYFTLPFLQHPMHGVAYDVDKEDTSFDKVGGRRTRDGGGSEWFDFDQ